MTDLPSSTGTAPAGADDAAHSLSDELARLSRVLHALKTSAAVGSGAEARERAAHVLLFPLTRLGPMRQGALAELVHADPSTVSRHVAALVDQGLVRRTADESDGRASRLVVTDEGHAALETLRQERETHLDRITATWSDAELATFTTLFGRLLDDLAAALPTSGCSAPSDDRPPSVSEIR